MFIELQQPTCPLHQVTETKENYNTNNYNITFTENVPT